MLFFVDVVVTVSLPIFIYLDCFIVPSLNMFNLFGRIKSDSERETDRKNALFWSQQITFWKVFVISQLREISLYLVFSFKWNFNSEIRCLHTRPFFISILALNVLVQVPSDYLVKLQWLIIDVNIIFQIKFYELIN